MIHDDPWVDADDSEVEHNVYMDSHNDKKIHEAWIRALPQIGKLLGFKLQKQKSTYVPSDSRYPEEETTNYRVVRNDLLTRVKDKKNG